jgi:hypothetical protein
MKKQSEEKIIELINKHLLDPHIYPEISETIKKQISKNEWEVSIPRIDMRHILYYTLKLSAEDANWTMGMIPKLIKKELSSKGFNAEVYFNNPSNNPSNPLHSMFIRISLKK